MGPTMKITTTRTPAEDCARVKDLGYDTSRHVQMCGETFEIVSDPITEGGGVSVQAVSVENPKDTNMTYCRVEFLTPLESARPAKKFRTEEYTKKHAKRVLCLDEDSRLEAKAVIIPVDRQGIPT